MQESAPPRVKYPLGVTAAAIAAGVIAMFSAMTLYSVTRLMNETSRDPFQVQLASVQFAPVGSRLPANAVLGYVSDLDLNTDSGKAAFFAAQYAVAPRILVDAAKFERVDLVLGNWGREQDYAAAGRPRGLTLIEDLGNGIVLYRKGAR
jgi:hypothetical protein